MSLPKMHWLPKDQWEAPRAVTGVDELSGKAPLSGLFSGFWPSPCLLPDSVGADPSSLLASESAGCSVQPAHLEGEAELLDVAVVPGLASPASQPSDGSPQAGVPAAEQPDPAELKHNHGRGAQARDPSPRSNTQQGAALPGNTEPEHEREQAGSRLTAKRNRDDAYDGSPSDPDNQRPLQRSRAEGHDRSLSRDDEERRHMHKTEDHYKQSRSREASPVKAGALQSKHVSRDRQLSASRSHSACRKDEKWPFRRGRIIPCSTRMSVEMLGNLKFGSDHQDDLEGLNAETAVFLWNYEKQKMHGIFAGTSRPVQDTSKHADYLYEVRVKNYAEYPSLPKEVALRLVPRDGKTRRGETLLKPYLDADHVDRLCSAFAK